jgi:hypothetical protein
MTVNITVFWGVIFHMFTHVSEERVALNFGVANPED